MKVLVVVLVLLGSLPPAAAADACVPEAGPARMTAPRAVDELLFARPFTLERGYGSYSLPGRPLVKSGLFVVLRADPALTTPRAVVGPVLYAGGHPLEIVAADASGHVAAIVPLDLALEALPLWFAPPPEKELNEASIETQWSAARAAKLAPLGRSQAERALVEGGARLHVANRGELLETLRPVLGRFGLRF